MDGNGVSFDSAAKDGDNKGVSFAPAAKDGPQKQAQDIVKKTKHETASPSFYRPTPSRERAARSVYVSRPSVLGFGFNRLEQRIPEEMSHPVLLNIYELSPCCVCCEQCPCSPGVLLGKLTCMGLFHCGIEFPGEREYTYNGRFGLFLNRKPREAVHTYHSPMRYAYSVIIGEHTATEEELMPMIVDLHERGYKLGQYNFIKRNCNHFCEDLCRLLGLPPPPRYLNRFARFGARFLYCRRNLVGSWEETEEERKAEKAEAFDRIASGKEDKVAAQRNVLKDSRYLTKDELASIGWDDEEDNENEEEEEKE